MNAYADTGFLISLYGQDANSVKARALDRRHQPIYWVTEFGETEFTNAVQSCVFKQIWKLSEAVAVLRLFREHLETGALEEKALPAELWKTATSLSLLHTWKLGTRTLDVLHVAIASLLMPDALFTFRRATRATRAGCAAASPAGLTLNGVSRWFHQGDSKRFSGCGEGGIVFSQHGQRDIAQGPSESHKFKLHHYLIKPHNLITRLIDFAALAGV